ncbi:MAG: UDP-glucose 4-epimerase GalE [Promethearchaeota archaeon]
MSKIILVSGGAGYIGSHTVHMMKEKGYEVEVIDSLEKGHQAALPSDVPCHIGRIGDDRFVEEIMQRSQFDGVLHFSGYIEVGESVLKPAKFIQNNLQEAITFLDVCKQNGIKKFIFSSSAAVYGIPKRVPIKETFPKDPINTYGVSKLAFEYVLESYAKAYNMTCVALRYFNAAGAAFGIGEDHNPETHLIPIVLQAALGQRPEMRIYGTDYETPDGTCIRDYIHIEDLAQAHILALEKSDIGFDAYNLGNGQGYSVKEIIETARDVTAKEIIAVPSSRRPGDPDRLIADPTKAMQKLNWKPKRSLVEIILSAWKWHSNNPNGFESKD